MMMTARPSRAPVLLALLVCCLAGGCAAQAQGVRIGVLFKVQGGPTRATNDALVRNVVRQFTSDLAANNVTLEQVEWVGAAAGEPGLTCAAANGSWVNAVMRILKPTPEALVIKSTVEETTPEEASALWAATAGAVELPAGPPCLAPGSINVTLLPGSIPKPPPPVRPPPPSPRPPPKPSIPSPPPPRRMRPPPSPKPSPPLPRPPPIEPPSPSPIFSPSPSPSPSPEPSPSPSASPEPSPSPDISPSPSPDPPSPSPSPSPTISPSPSLYSPSPSPYSPSPSPYSPSPYLSPYISPSPGVPAPQPGYAPVPAPEPALSPVPAPAPAPEPPLPMCMTEPTCQMFIADSLCCLEYGIVLHAAARVWVVCNADVYLPQPQCLTVVDTATKAAIPPLDPNNPDPLNTVNVTVVETPNARSTELLVDLPLAYYVPPVSNRPGELAVRLDLESARVAFADGLCSLRLRVPCQYEGVVYESVTAVRPVPLLSVLSANETADAAEEVLRVAASQEDGEGDQEAQSEEEQDAEQQRRRSLRAARGISLSRRVAAGAGRRLKQELLGDEGSQADPWKAGEGLLEYLGVEELSDGLDLGPFDAPGRVDGRMLITTVGSELRQPEVDEASLPPLTDVLSSLEGLQADLLTEDYFISWIPTNATLGEACQMTNAGDLPEAFLLGNFEDLVGYEEECTPESVLETTDSALEVPLLG